MNNQIVMAGLEALAEKLSVQLGSAMQENRRLAKLLDDGLAKLEADELKLGKSKVDLLVGYFKAKEKKDEKV